MPRCLDFVAPLAKVGWQPVGRVTARSAREIGSSPWGIGLETMDRGYVDFAPVAPYLGPLGATEARVQAGWARCDPGPGRPLEWSWLDEIVEGCLAAGVRPWLQTSYGNPSYEGGGGIGLVQGVPQSPEALAAWDRWVAALVERYRDRVTTYEIWNEADHREAVTVEDYVSLYLRTARIIRERQPQAHLIGLSLAGNLTFAEGFMRAMAEGDFGSLIDAITFHGYPVNPDHEYEMFDRLVALRDRWLPGVELRQGETGCPSQRMEGISLALNKDDWTERKQAVWNLRRLLNHHRRGIRMSLFQLADMRYSRERGALFEGLNPKGLVALREDKSVSHVKPAYFAAQHVFSLWDSGYPLRPLAPLAASAEPAEVAAFCWQRAGHPSPNLIAWWQCAERPSLVTPELGRVIFPDLPPLVDPVLIDLLSGTVFTSRGSGDLRAPLELPCADSPFVLIERGTLPWQPMESGALSVG